jgi:hypothetical protein
MAGQEWSSLAAKAGTIAQLRTDIPACRNFTDGSCAPANEFYNRKAPAMKKPSLHCLKILNVRPSECLQGNCQTDVVVCNRFDAVVYRPAAAEMRP